ncbi:unnamed protein product, partial [Sphacelaria rigidula]
VVNKDTGQVVGDLRAEGGQERFDVLPSHFRPSEAWHAPEHETQAMAAAASPLDLAGAETHSRRAGARKMTGGATRTGGSKKIGHGLQSMIFRRLKARDHNDEHDVGQGCGGGGGAAGGRGTGSAARSHPFAVEASGFEGGGGVVGFDGSKVEQAQHQAQHQAQKQLGGSDRARSGDESAAVLLLDARTSRSSSDPAVANRASASTAGTRIPTGAGGGGSG